MRVLGVILPALGLLYSAQVFAQDAYVQFSYDWCHCLDTTKLDNSIVIDSCYEAAFELNREAIRKETPIAEGEDQYEAGFRYGYLVTQQAMLLMADSCASFLEAYEHQRHALFRNQDKLTLRKELINLKTDTSVKDQKFQEALIYARLNEFDKALVLCNEALTINPSDYNSLKLTGYIWEVQGNLEGAKDVYQYLYEVSGDAFIGMDAAIVRQKIRMRK